MKNFILILCCLLLCLIANTVKGEIVDRILAIVDDTVITLSQVDRFLDQYVNMNHPERKKNLRKQLLENMVNELIFEHEAIRKGIDAQKTETDEYINNLISQKGRTILAVLP